MYMVKVDWLCELCYCTVFDLFVSSRSPPEVHMIEIMTVRVRRAHSGHFAALIFGTCSQH